MKKSRLHIEGKPLTNTNYAAKLAEYNSWETPVIMVASKGKGKGKGKGGGGGYVRVCVRVCVCVCSCMAHRSACRKAQSL